MQTATPADCRPDWLIRAHSPKSAMAVHSFGKTPNVSNELALLIRTPVAINERLMTLSVPLASRFMTVYLCLCPDTYIRGDCKVPLVSGSAFFIPMNLQRQTIQVCQGFLLRWTEHLSELLNCMNTSIPLFSNKYLSFHSFLILMIFLHFMKRLTQ